MDYYHGRTLTILGDRDIRVEPKNIQGNEVMELEMLLPHPAGLIEGKTFGKSVTENRWTTLVSGRPNQTPAVRGSKVLLDIDGEERGFRFNQSNR